MGDTVRDPGRPAAVRALEQAMSDWLASFTSPAALAAEMADACGRGAAWTAAIGAVSSRRAGWGDAEAMAWGLCAGGLAGALSAARASLATEARAARSEVTRPARALLAADGLIAAAHETLGSLPPERAGAALAALAQAFGDGGPWRQLSVELPDPAWAAVVPCALGPAAAADPGGPWAAWAKEWRAAHGANATQEAGAPRALQPDDRALWDHPAADPDTRALLRAAARAAAGDPRSA